ncbi:uncharacterized protein F4822DRAFT_48476 [Hypoxylon trugodes]|uniref:uncharacterized protein n=1 Tax=Hypoxylon trugodes TaxID=326681 RepID=UPI002193E0E0|nr:uncharacterized protein F4822DRAFT_48476 [Hypoxylon trugodes]KAI1394471.1 hypothetical protein F4822DRAFT_48476 [Hypoxylon trugodes]
MLSRPGNSFVRCLSMNPGPWRRDMLPSWDLYNMVAIDEVHAYIILHSTLHLGRFAGDINSSRFPRAALAIILISFIERLLSYLLFVFILPTVFLTLGLHLCLGIFLPRIHSGFEFRQLTISNLGSGSPLSSCIAYTVRNTTVRAYYYTFYFLF